MYGTKYVQQLSSVKTCPICSACPWWCSEALTAGPTGEETVILWGMETVKVRDMSLSSFKYFTVDKHIQHGATSMNTLVSNDVKMNNDRTICFRFFFILMNYSTKMRNVWWTPVNRGWTVPFQTSVRAITASWSCDRAETRYWTTSGPEGGPHRHMWGGGVWNLFTAAG